MSWLDENHAVALTSVVTVRSGLSSFWLILKVVQPTRVKQVRNNGIKFFMVLTKNNKIKHLSCQVYNLLFLYIKNRFQRVTLLLSNAFTRTPAKRGRCVFPSLLAAGTTWLRAPWLYSATSTRILAFQVFSVTR